ncbi:MAG TPA: phosphatase PAP2 family protein, partial [Caulobacter sp.]|nr:phosphatase PAP2 family protein [Caulobacter sp.]
MRTITPLALAILLAPMAAHADKTDPYLAEAQRPDARVVLAPPPAPGSPSYTADMLIFQETRALEGTERWVMATDDAPISIASLMALFACALDRDIDADRLPRLATIIARLAVDGDAVLDDAKAHFRRPRPFQSARGSVCQAREDLLHSYDYPSGHATFGWLVGLLMAELAPDRATAVLARARAYGESRIVCGAHN